MLRFSNDARVAVAIRKGEQFVEVADFGSALKEYQKALDVARNSSLAHFRIGQVHRDTAPVFQPQIERDRRRHASPIVPSMSVS